MFYFLSRIPTAIVTMVFVATLCFFLVKAAGENAAFGEKNPPPAVREEVTRTWGLDKPIHEQWWMHMKRLAVLDSMPSRIQKGKSLRDVLSEQFPSSLRLGLRAMVLALLFGVPIGVLCAVYHNRFLDNAGTIAALVGVSVPSFVIASVSIFYLCREWNWFPSVGWERTSAANLDQYPALLRPIVEEIGRVRLWVPAACLAAFPFAAILRLTRSSMLEALRQDYVRTARAKGVNPWKVVLLHALRNALTPVVTYVGPITAGVLTGSLVVEKVFAIPGLGSFFIQSVNNRDMPIIMGLTVFYSGLLVGMNLVVDALYPVLNPRLKR